MERGIYVFVGCNHSRAKPLSQKVNMLTTAEIRQVTYQSSPTGAHWYNCQYQLDGLVGHTHEFQTCKYCRFVQTTPCYWCQPKAKKVQTKGERFNRTLPKKKKAA